MKPVVMQLLVALRMGGAERLALTILRQGRGRFTGIVGGMLHEPGDLAQAAEDEGFSCVAFRADECGRLRGTLRLLQTLRRRKVSLLHVQAAYLLPYALPAARLAGIPLVYTEHALHSLRSISWLRNFVRLSAPLLHGIVCVTESVAEYFTGELGIAEKRVRVIRNGVDTDCFTPDGPRAELPWTAGEGVFVFGNVARLSEAKDHATLLHAFALVRQSHPEARLLLVGDGEKREAVEALRAELGLGDTVHISGMCLDVPAMLRSMDAFVLSSKREGLPMAVLEAMASGVPVVSTEVGGVGRLSDGEQRLLTVPPENPEALAGAMRTLVTISDKGAALARRAREHVMNSYGSEAMARDYFLLYDGKGGRQ